MTESRQVAVITGAGRGMGRAIAIALATAGADCVISDLSAESCAETCAAIAALGRQARSLAWDVSQIAEIPAQVAAAQALFGRIDILVNNAGVLYLPDTAPDWTPERGWDFVVDINLKAVHFICESTCELMRDQGGGTIINMASDAGLRGGSDPYHISKRGVVGLTAGFSRRFAHHGVRINAIAPGPVATDMMGCSDGVPAEDAGLPLGRFARADEIASVAAFLASPAAHAIHGQSIVVNSATSW